MISRYHHRFQNGGWWFSKSVFPFHFCCSRYSAVCVCVYVRVYLYAWDFCVLLTFVTLFSRIVTQTRASYWHTERIFSVDERQQQKIELILHSIKCFLKQILFVFGEFVVLLCFLASFSNDILHVSFALFFLLKLRYSLVVIFLHCHCLMWWIHAFNEYIAPLNKRIGKYDFVCTQLLLLLLLLLYRLSYFIAFIMPCFALKWKNHLFCHFKLTARKSKSALSSLPWKI